VRTHHAYADLKGLDLDALAKEEIDRIGTNPTLGEAVLAAQRFIARLGDGHASVEDWLAFAPQGRLDALFQHANGGVVAFRRDPREVTGELLDSDHPYVSSMDGVPIERWIEAASAYVTDGSPALVRRRSAGLLRYVNLVRDELDLPHDPTVDLRLRNADGSSTADLQITVTDRRGIYGVWPRSESRVLDSGIGYIRLDRMHRAGPELEAIERDLMAMVDAPGLIIDVRGNGGGRRDAITLLAPLFLDDEPDGAGEPPARVINTARALLSVRDDPDDPNGHLANRRAFPASWAGWSPAERSAIEGFKANFEPQWEPPRGRFSGPHYTVVSRKPGDPIYNGPVVVLLDEGCFSATDILLGSLKGLPRVTLMGMPSSGGSARSRGHDIDSLGATVTLASMVSHMPDGRLYDGNGIQPDAVIPVEPSDLIGEADTQLDAAIENLLAAAGQ
ncbi:MAG: S41 family peptidase, partial [Planctomycetota bacterium]